MVQAPDLTNNNPLVPPPPGDSTLKGNMPATRGDKKMPQVFGGVFDSKCTPEFWYWPFGTNLPPYLCKDNHDRCNLTSFILQTDYQVEHS